VERYEREISRDVYERAMKNHRRITTEDMCDVFSRAELCGYGIYDTYVIERNDGYYVLYEIGTDCD
jgi:hypothetical protein